MKPASFRSFESRARINEFWRLALLPALRDAGFHAVQVGDHGRPIHDENHDPAGVRVHVRGCLPVTFNVNYELPPRQTLNVSEMRRAHEVVLRCLELDASLRRIAGECLHTESAWLPDGRLVCTGCDMEDWA